MDEPRKYTAKDAMHWMIENRSEIMISSNRMAHFYGQGKFHCSFLDEFDGIEEWEEDRVIDERTSTFYVRSEYYAWQESLKKQEESAEPKEGESLRDYLIRRLEGSGVGYDNALQTWIESYVQREIRKALGGL